MPLRRCSDQGNIGLHEFYEEAKTYPASKAMAIEMQKIVAWLDHTFPETKLFGLTSHYNLLLLSEDISYANKYVKITADPIRYYIDYLMPQEIAPWKGAWVTGWTDNLEDAKKYILIGMKNSKGWEESEELKKHF